MYKQVIIVRKDLGMTEGKLAAQACHGAVSVLSKTKKIIVESWEKSGQKKVILQAKDLDQLMKLREKCAKMRLPCAIVADAGLTELTPGTITVLAIGPDKEEKIDKITGSLPLLK